MTDIIYFEVAGNPQALKRHRTFRRGAVNIQTDPSKGDKADFLALAHKHKPDKPLDEPLHVEIIFFFSRPKSHYRTGKFAHELKCSAPIWHTKTPDADNLVKFVCDSLNGVFWRDDSVIYSLFAIKAYSDKPRTVVTVRGL